MATIAKKTGSYWKGYDGHWSFISNFRNDGEENLQSVANARATRIIWQKARSLARKYGWRIDKEESSSDRVYVLFRTWTEGQGCPDYEEEGHYVCFSIAEG